MSFILLVLSGLLNNEEKISLYLPSYKESKQGTIEIGYTADNYRKKYPFYLSLRDLEKHVFICGASGTGKSTFVQSFLVNLYGMHQIPFFLVEFKGEYHFLENLIPNLSILKPGKNFSLNIFNPHDLDPSIHAERIFDIIQTGVLWSAQTEYSPQMEKVFIDIFKIIGKRKRLHNWKGFNYACNLYLDRMEDSIPMLRQTIISIQNRIRRYATGPLSVLFECTNHQSQDELFRNNVLLDLSSIIRLGGNKTDALFFLNMILKYLWDLNLERGSTNFYEINHLIIIEDAQYFASENLLRNNTITSYLEDIALLLRGTGECLITIATRPNISKEILANNGVILTFNNHIEKEKICELLNLSTENKEVISSLERGYSIVRVNSLKYPFLLKTPDILNKKKCNM